MVTGMLGYDINHILDNSGIDYVVRKNQCNVAFSCEDVARERGVALSQVLKCMVGKDSEGNVYVMLVSGNKNIDLKKVERLLEGKKINFVPREELSTKYGLIVGAINPIHFIGKATFFLDQTVEREEYVDISSGSPNAGIELKVGDLIKLIKPMICDIISEKRGA